jgi:hypothetical protein
MALLKPTLKDGIQSIIDQEYSGFTQFPSSVLEAAERWSIAIDNYASLVTPPSTTSQAASQALKAKLLLAENLGVDAFKLGLIEYATVLAGGMAPTFTGVPPVTPPIFEPIFAAGFAGADSATIAELLSSMIDLWFKTGTAINNTSGVTLTWI